jgi:hypothetical protein
MLSVNIEVQIEQLPPDRRQAVLTWLTGTLGECPSCGSPVRRTHARSTGKSGWEHRDCRSVAAGDAVPAPAEPTSAAVEARARRSDWG